MDAPRRFMRKRSDTERIPDDCAYARCLELSCSWAQEVGGRLPGEGAGSVEWFTGLPWRVEGSKVDGGGCPSVWAYLMPPNCTLKSD